MQPSMLQNPLRAGSRLERTPDPAIMVIFGASGDLTKRKLMPALYSLVRSGQLPAGLCIVGVARRELSHDGFRESMHEAVDQHSRLRPVDDATWSELAPRIFYHQSDFGDPKGHARLAQLLDQVDTDFGMRGNRVYYLATPPDFFPDVAKNLGHAGLARNDSAKGFRRIVVEKPFGRDLESALALDRVLAEHFHENQIFRIDHYLGKETVQNILVLRFANGIFEPLWNQKYVDHVQITVSEDLGIENRGDYFESAGILRDIVQNHVLQLLALTAMEAPIAWEANAVRDEKAKVLRAVRPISRSEVEDRVVRGQYGAGWSQGEAVRGYRQEKKVAERSIVETFVALELYIDNWRWAGVPFYLRAGKRLPKRVTEIAIQFKPVPHLLFGAQSAPQPNTLALRIQPDEGISLRIVSKSPGPEIDLQSVSMDFRYGTSFGQEPPEAYERLLLDAVLGDASLYTRRDTLERSWELVDAIEAGWRERGSTSIPTYEAGSWGPTEADALLATSGRIWRRP